MENVQKKSYVLPIAVMFALFFMIAFVTNFAGSMGVIVKNQFGASNALSQLGTLANFIAYAFMGIPAGIILKRKGYKFTSLAAVTVGFVGVGIQFLSGYAESFLVYVLGAFVAGFSMCLLNIVVNPMLNTLGGGGNKGNQLIQLGGSCNSIGATLAPVLLGYLIGGSVEDANVMQAAPAMIIAMAIFALAAIIIALTKIPEPHMETAEERAARLGGKVKKDKYGPMSFRHFVLGAVAIFFYVGIEVGIPNIANLYMTTPTTEQAQQTIDKYLAQNVEAEPATEDESVLEEVVAEEAAAAEEAAVEGDEAVVAVEEAVADDVVVAEENAPATEDVDVESAEAVEDDVVSVEKYQKALDVTGGKAVPGLGMGADIAGLIIAAYWFLMMCGRLIGSALGAKISSKNMLIGVSTLATLFVLCIMFVSSSTNLAIPFTDYVVPANLIFVALCGLCTSIMWGGIFNLAAEGLGKYTPAASGIFMAMVCGGGIIPALQGLLADFVGYMTSYWLIVACLCYLLFYALVGCKNVNKDIPTE